MGERPYQHDAILQRLNTYLQNNGRPVFYSLESFLNTQDWEDIPLVFKTVNPEGPITHPQHDAVRNGQLEPSERFVGKVGYAYIPPEGQPRLCAILNITDIEVEKLARDGRLGISTGFEGDFMPETEDQEGPVRITGAVRPNHVLLFEQGACPNCWPNDAAAMFENTQEQKNMAPIDNESKGWLKAIHDRICNNTKTADKAEDNKVDNTMAAAEIDNLKAEIMQLKNTIETKDARIAELEAADAQRAKDAAWATMKNTLPKGWITPETEAETRALFENSKDEFYAKLMSHKEQFGNTKTAEGAKSCGCPKTEAAQIDNIKNEVSAATGFTIVEE